MEPPRRCRAWDTRPSTRCSAAADCRSTATTTGSRWPSTGRPPRRLHELDRQPGRGSGADPRESGQSGFNDGFDVAPVPHRPGPPRPRATLPGIRWPARTPRSPATTAGTTGGPEKSTTEAGHSANAGCERNKEDSPRGSVPRLASGPHDAGHPYYPLIVVALAVAATAFWRRARYHVAVLRARRPLNRSTTSLHRIWGFIVYVDRPEAAAAGPGPRADARLHLLGLPWRCWSRPATTSPTAWSKTVLAWPPGRRAVDARRPGWPTCSSPWCWWGWGTRSSVASWCGRPRLALSRDAFVILALSNT